MNELLFFLHVFIVVGCSLGALWVGKEALIAFVCLQGVLSNLLVLKQISLFGFNATCADVFVVGTIFSLNLLQEYFGKNLVKKVIFINFYLFLFYIVMTQIHLWYIPNQFDNMHLHFKNILWHMPRVTAASLVVYLFVQIFNAYLYGLLKNVFRNNYPIVHNFLSLAISQFVDTVLFGLLGLYGIVGNLWQIIFVSFLIKIIVVLTVSPFSIFAKKIVKTSR
jgi:queuosine precursor transporter